MDERNLPDQAMKLQSQGALRAAATAWSRAAKAASRADDRANCVIAAARCVLWMGQASRAIEMAESVLSHMPDHTGPARALIARAQTFTGDFAAARTATLAAATELGEDDGAAWLDIAHAQATLGDPDACVRALAKASAGTAPASRRDVTLCRYALRLDASAIQSLQRLAAIARRDGAVLVQAQAMTLLGRAHVELRDYTRGRAMHGAALSMHRSCGHMPGVIASLGGLGLCALGTAATAQGIQHLNQAIQLARELHALPAEGAWRVHLDEALVILDRGEWRVKELTRFIEVVHQLDDAAWEASLWCALGHTQREVRDHEAALAAYRHALEISEARSDDQAASIDLASIGLCHQALGRSIEALDAFDRAIARAPFADAPHVIEALAARDALRALE
jgi:tetratricopeptide (TPR) repeat protein